MQKVMKVEDFNRWDREDVDLFVFVFGILG